jgi:serine/threonine protein kinase
VESVAPKFGSYAIHEELGAGGLASVHLAESPAIKSRVALKRLYPHVAEIPELVASFIDEARIAKYLRHPNIARVYEFGRLGGVYFIAFEFVPGPTVQQLQRQCREHVGRVPVPIAIEIMSQVCDALDHAHNLRDEHNQPLKIVHRDVSPSNLIVSNVGLVKLIDFGLAKTKQSTVESQAGVIKGKLNYVAPEYLRGKLDARCDLWAVGVVLHELLTGTRLFNDPDNVVTLERVRAMPIPPPSRFNPEVSIDLDQVVMTALERNPGRRWQSAVELRNALVRATTRTVTKDQLVAWTEWAFSQKQRPLENSSVSALHEIIDSKELLPVSDALPQMSNAMLERRRESLAQMPRLGDAMLERRAAPRWVVFAGLLVLAALVALAVVFARHPR